jgi:hypothetical protein
MDHYLTSSVTAMYVLSSSAAPTRKNKDHPAHFERFVRSIVERAWRAGQIKILTTEFLNIIFCSQDGGQYLRPCHSTKVRPEMRKEMHMDEWNSNNKNIRKGFKNQVWAVIQQHRKALDFGIERNASELARMKPEPVW